MSSRHPTPQCSQGRPQGRFSSSSRAWGMGKMTLPAPQSPPTHTHTHTPLCYPEELKRKNATRQSYETGWWGRYKPAEGANPRAWASRGQQPATAHSHPRQPSPPPAGVRGLISRLAHVGSGARSSLHEFGAGSSSPNLGQFVQLQ